ncbi:MAG: LysM peptidoglycan-binding domain-containing protein [Tannerella sp.]|jgi:membrane-bound lytic murein transglycosylase D|nr:LysM peptidoglycan-binding domain-containing protein [Tannerella sp.]
MKKLHLILIISIIFTSANAQRSQDDDYNPNDTLPELQQIDSIVGYLPEALDENLHQLLEGWHLQHFTKPEEFCSDEDINPIFDEETYRDRIARMPFVIPMTYNKTVRTCIDRYTVKMRRWMRSIMGMADFYFPMIEQHLDAHGLPLELKYLAVVESALNPTVQSHAGAAGLWQFILPTGKVYGMEINSLIDERYDPEKATLAACKYFVQMYNTFDDWLLALAAYNCGPGNVEKAIRRAKGNMDFWNIFQYLPRETRSYVPMFMAAAYVMTYHCEHNLCPVRADFSVATDTVLVERPLHFDQIAAVLQMEKEAIRFYNPQYKREVIPGNVRPSVLRLPIDRTRSFVAMSDSMYAYRRDSLLAYCTPVDFKNPENRKERITHKVKAGETMHSISNLYGVSITDLRRWNGNIRARKPATGSNLKVFIDNGGIRFATTTTSTPKATSNATPKATSTPTSKATQTQNQPTKQTSKSASKSYTVQSGDSLYGIAQKYPGMTVKKLQDANGLTSTNLHVGQKLIIPAV